MPENTQPESTDPHETGEHGPGCNCPKLPDDHSTVTLHMVMGTPGGKHAMELTVKFPKDMGLTAAQALGTQMDTIIGPAFMEELAHIEDAQMAGFLRSIRPSAN